MTEPQGFRYRFALIWARTRGFIAGTLVLVVVVNFVVLILPGPSLDTKALVLLVANLLVGGVFMFVLTRRSHAALDDASEADATH